MGLYAGLSALWTMAQVPSYAQNAATASLQVNLNYSMSLKLLPAPTGNKEPDSTVLSPSGGRWSPGMRFRLFSAGPCEFWLATTEKIISRSSETGPLLSYRYIWLPEDSLSRFLYPFDMPDASGAPFHGKSPDSLPVYLFVLTPL